MYGNQPGKQCRPVPLQLVREQSLIPWNPESDPELSSDSFRNLPTKHTKQEKIMENEKHTLTGDEFLAAYLKAPESIQKRIREILGLDDEGRTLEEDHTL